MRFPISKSYKLASYLEPFSVVGQFFAADKLGTPVCQICFGGTLKLMTTKFRKKNFKTLMYLIVQTLFRYLEPFWRGLRV